MRTRTTRFGVLLCVILLCLSIVVIAPEGDGVTAAPTEQAGDFNLDEFKQNPTASNLFAHPDPQGLNYLLEKKPDEALKFLGDDRAFSDAAMANSFFDELAKYPDVEAKFFSGGGDAVKSREAFSRIVSKMGGGASNPASKFLTKQYHAPYVVSAVAVDFVFDAELKKITNNGKTISLALFDTTNPDTGVAASRIRKIETTATGILIVDSEDGTSSVSLEGSDVLTLDALSTSNGKTQYQVSQRDTVVLVSSFSAPVSVRADGGKLVTTASDFQISGSGADSFIRVLDSHGSFTYNPDGSWEAENAKIHTALVYVEGTSTRVVVKDGKGYDYVLRERPLNTEDEEDAGPSVFVDKVTKKGFSTQGNSVTVHYDQVSSTSQFSYLFRTTENAASTPATDAQAQQVAQAARAQQRTDANGEVWIKTNGAQTSVHAVGKVLMQDYVTEQGALSGKPIVTLNGKSWQGRSTDSGFDMMDSLVGTAFTASGQGNYDDAQGGFSSAQDGAVVVKSAAGRDAKNDRFKVTCDSCANGEAVEFRKRALIVDERSTARAFSEVGGQGGDVTFSYRVKDGKMELAPSLVDLGALAYLSGSGKKVVFDHNLFVESPSAGGGSGSSYFGFTSEGVGVYTKGLTAKGKDGELQLVSVADVSSGVGTVAIRFDGRQALGGRVIVSEDDAKKVNALLGSIKSGNVAALRKMSPDDFADAGVVQFIRDEYGIDVSQLDSQEYKSGFIAAYGKRKEQERLGSELRRLGVNPTTGVCSGCGDDQELNLQAQKLLLSYRKAGVESQQAVAKAKVFSVDSTADGDDIKRMNHLSAQVSSLRARIDELDARQADLLTQQVEEQANSDFLMGKGRTSDQDADLGKATFLATEQRRILLRQEAYQKELAEMKKRAKEYFDDARRGSPFSASEKIGYLDVTREGIKRVEREIMKLESEKYSVNQELNQLQEKYDKGDNANPLMSVLLRAQDGRNYKQQEAFAQAAQVGATDAAAGAYLRGVACKQTGDLSCMRDVVLELGDSQLQGDLKGKYQDLTKSVARDEFVRKQAEFLDYQDKYREREFERKGGEPVSWNPVDWVLSPTSISNPFEIGFQHLNFKESGSALLNYDGDIATSKSWSEIDHDNEVRVLSGLQQQMHDAANVVVLANEGYDYDQIGTSYHELLIKEGLAGTKRTVVDGEIVRTSGESGFYRESILPQSYAVRGQKIPESLVAENERAKIERDFQFEHQDFSAEGEARARAFTEKYKDQGLAGDVERQLAKFEDEQVRIYVPGIVDTKVSGHLVGDMAATALSVDIIVGAEEIAIGGLMRGVTTGVKVAGKAGDFLTKARFISQADRDLQNVVDLFNAEQRVARYAREQQALVAVKDIYGVQDLEEARILHSVEETRNADADAFMDVVARYPDSTALPTPTVREIEVTDNMIIASEVSDVLEDVERSGGSNVVDFAAKKKEFEELKVAAARFEEAASTGTLPEVEAAAAEVAQLEQNFNLLEPTPPVSRDVSNICTLAIAGPEFDESDPCGRSRGLPLLSQKVAGQIVHEQTRLGTIPGLPTFKPADAVNDIGRTPAGRDIKEPFSIGQSDRSGTNVIPFRDERATPRVPDLDAEGVSVDSSLGSVDGLDGAWNFEPDFTTSPDLADIVRSGLEVVHPITAAKNAPVPSLQLDLHIGGDIVKQDVVHFIIKDSELVPITSESQLVFVGEGQVVYTGLLDSEGHIFAYSPAVKRDGQFVRGASAEDSIHSKWVFDNKLVQEKISVYNRKIQGEMSEPETVIKAYESLRNDLGLQPVLSPTDLEAAKIPENILHPAIPVEQHVERISTARTPTDFEEAFKPVRERFNDVDIEIRKTLTDIARLNQAKDSNVARVLSLENKVRDLRAQKVKDFNTLFSVDLQGMAKEGRISPSLADELDSLRDLAAKEVISDLVMRDPYVVQKFSQTKKFKDFMLLEENKGVARQILYRKFIEKNVNIDRIGTPKLTSDVDINVRMSDSLISEVFPTIRERFESIFAISKDNPSNAKLGLQGLPSNGLGDVRRASFLKDGKTLLDSEYMPNSDQFLYRLQGLKNSNKVLVTDIPREEAISQMSYHITGMTKATDAKTIAKYDVRSFQAWCIANAECHTFWSAKSKELGLEGISSYQVEMAAAQQFLSGEELGRFTRSYDIYRGGAVSSLDLEVLRADALVDAQRRLNSNDLMELFQDVNKKLDPNLEEIVKDARNTLGKDAPLSESDFVGRYEQNIKGYLQQRLVSAGVAPDVARDMVSKHSFEAMLEFSPPDLLVNLGLPLDQLDVVGEILREANDDIRRLNFRVQKVKYEKASGKSFDSLFHDVSSVTRDTVEIPVVKGPALEGLPGSEGKLNFEEARSVKAVFADSEKSVIQGGTGRAEAKFHIGSEGELVVVMQNGNRPSSELTSALDSLSQTGQKVNVINAKEARVLGFNSENTILPSDVLNRLGREPDAAMVNTIGIAPQVNDVASQEVFITGIRQGLTPEQQSVIRLPLEKLTLDGSTIHVTEGKVYVAARNQNRLLDQSHRDSSSAIAQAQARLKEQGLELIIQDEKEVARILNLNVDPSDAGALRRKLTENKVNPADLFERRDIQLKLGLAGSVDGDVVNSNFVSGAIDVGVKREVGVDSVAQVSGDGVKGVARVDTVDLVRSTPSTPVVPLRGTPVADAAQERVVSSVVSVEDRVKNNVDQLGADLWNTYADTVNQGGDSRFIQVDVDSHGRLLPVGQDGFKVTFRSNKVTGEFVVVPGSASRGLSVEARKVLDLTAEQLSKRGVGKVVDSKIVPSVGSPAVPMREVPIDAAGSKITRQPTTGLDKEVTLPESNSLDTVTDSVLPVTAPVAPVSALPVTVPSQSDALSNGVESVVSGKKLPPPLPVEHVVADMDILSSEIPVSVVYSESDLADMDLFVEHMLDTYNVELHVGQVDGVPTIEYWVGPQAGVNSPEEIARVLDTIRSAHRTQFGSGVDAHVLYHPVAYEKPDGSVLVDGHLFEIEDDISLASQLGIVGVSDKSVLVVAQDLAQGLVNNKVEGAEAVLAGIKNHLDKVERYEAYQRKGAIGKFWERLWKGEPQRLSIVGSTELEQKILKDAKEGVAQANGVRIAETSTGAVGDEIDPRFSVPFDDSVESSVRVDAMDGMSVGRDVGEVGVEKFASGRLVSDESGLLPRAPTSEDHFSVSSCSFGGRAFDGGMDDPCSKFVRRIGTHSDPAKPVERGTRIKLQDKDGNVYDVRFASEDSGVDGFIYVYDEDGLVHKISKDILLPGVYVSDEVSVAGVKELTFKSVADSGVVELHSPGTPVEIIRHDGTMTTGYLSSEESHAVVITNAVRIEGVRGNMVLEAVDKSDIAAIRFSDDLKLVSTRDGNINLNSDNLVSADVDMDVSGSSFESVGETGGSSTVAMDFNSNPDLAPSVVLGSMKMDTPIRFSIDGKIYEGKLGVVEGDKLLYTNIRGQVSFVRVSRIDAGSVTELSIYESSLGLAKNSPVSISMSDGKVVSGKYLSEDDIFVYVKGLDSELYSIPKVDIALGKTSIASSLDVETVALDLSASTNRAKVSGLPSRTVDSAVSSHVVFRMPSGEQVRLPIVFRMEDRDFAVAKNLIRENPNLGALERGVSYNYVVLDDGTVVIGKVVDDLEFGVKHLHLANGRAVTVAGELRVGMDGKLSYNLNSNTFMNPLIQEGGSSVSGARNAFESIVKEQTGVIPSFETSSLIPHGPPTATHLDELCAGHFLNSNAGLCSVLGLGALTKGKKVSSIDDLILNNREVFAVQTQGHVQAHDMVKDIRLADGSRKPIIYTLADREFARSRGKLYEGVLPSSLPRGKSYTYVILEDGSMVFGEVENGLEFGVKHFHLANGRRVKAAGELRIAADGSYEVNLLSGTFSKPLVDFYGVPERDLESRVLSVFNSDAKMGEGVVVKNDLLPSRAPTVSEFEQICSSPVFALNRGACGVVTPEVPLVKKMVITVPVEPAAQADLFYSLSVRAKAAGNRELATEFSRLNKVASDRVSEGFFTRVKRRVFGSEEVPATMAIDDPAVMKTVEESARKRGVVWVTNEPPLIMQMRGEMAIAFKDSRGIVEINIPSSLNSGKIRADIDSLLREYPTISRDDFVLRVRAMGCSTPGLPVGGKAYVGKAAEEVCAVIGIKLSDPIPSEVDALSHSFSAVSESKTVSFHSSVAALQERGVVVQYVAGTDRVVVYVPGGVDVEKDIGILQESLVDAQISVVTSPLLEGQNVKSKIVNSDDLLLKLNADLEDVRGVVPDRNGAVLPASDGLVVGSFSSEAVSSGRISPGVQGEGARLMGSGVKGDPAKYVPTSTAPAGRIAPDENLMLRGDLDTPLAEMDEVAEFAARKNIEHLRSSQYSELLTRKSIKDGEIVDTWKVNGAGLITGNVDDVGVAVRINPSTGVVVHVAVPSGMSEDAARVLRASVGEYNRAVLKSADANLYARALEGGALRVTDIDVIRDAIKSGRLEEGILFDLESVGVNINNPSIAYVVRDFQSLEDMKKVQRLFDTASDVVSVRVVTKGPNPVRLQNNVLVLDLSGRERLKVTLPKGTTTERASQIGEKVQEVVGLNPTLPSDKLASRVRSEIGCLVNLGGRAIGGMADAACDVVDVAVVPIDVGYNPLDLVAPDGSVVPALKVGDRAADSVQDTVFVSSLKPRTISEVVDKPSIATLRSEFEAGNLPIDPDEFTQAVFVRNPDGTSTQVILNPDEYAIFVEKKYQEKGFFGRMFSSRAKVGAENPLVINRDQLIVDRIGAIPEGYDLDLVAHEVLGDTIHSFSDVRARLSSTLPVVSSGPDLIRAKPIQIPESVSGVGKAAFQTNFQVQRDAVLYVMEEARKRGLTGIEERYSKYLTQLDNGESVSLPKYFHASRRPEALVQTGVVEVRGELGFDGVFVSSKPEIGGEYGNVAFAFSDDFENFEQGLHRRGGDYTWLSSQENVPIDGATVIVSTTGNVPPEVAKFAKEKNIPVLSKQQWDIESQLLAEARVLYDRDNLVMEGMYKPTSVQVVSDELQKGETLQKYSKRVYSNLRDGEVLFTSDGYGYVKVKNGQKYFVSYDLSSREIMERRLNPLSDGKAGEVGLDSLFSGEGFGRTQVKINVDDGDFATKLSNGEFYPLDAKVVDTLEVISVENVVVRGGSELKLEIPNGIDRDAVSVRVREIAAEHPDLDADTLSRKIQEGLDEKWPAQCSVVAPLALAGDAIVNRALVGLGAGPCVNGVKVSVISKDASQGIMTIGQDRIGVSSADVGKKVGESANSIPDQRIMGIGVDRIGINPEVVDLNLQYLRRNPLLDTSTTVNVNGAGLVSPTGTHEVQIVTNLDGSVSSVGSAEHGVRVALPDSASDRDRVLALTAVAAIVGSGVVLSSDEMVDEIRDQVPCVGDTTFGCEVLDIEVNGDDTLSSEVGMNENIVSIPGKVSTGTPNLKQPVSFFASTTQVANTLSSITNTVVAKDNFAGKSYVTRLRGNENRDVEFYIPMGVDFAKPVNLVYLFHGLGDVEKTAKVTLPNGITAVESSTNTILVYPISAGKRGTGGGDGEWMSNQGGSNSISTLHTDTLNVLREMSPVPFTEGNVNVVCHSAGGQACRNIVSSGGLKKSDSAGVSEDVPVKYYLADSCYANWCGATIKGIRKVDTLAVRYNNAGKTGTKVGGEDAARVGITKPGQVVVEGSNEGHLDYILHTSGVMAAQSES